MDQTQRDFIAASTLLFIASRNEDGALDVSPRGGQPSVLRLAKDDTLLLPDLSGNRRLDTIGNVLARPEVALLLLNRGSERALRITARASVSFEPRHLDLFPADDNPPLSVMVLSPTRMEFVTSGAFAAAGFWIGPEECHPPLDLAEIVGGDIQYQAGLGLSPVFKNPAEETRLASAGIRDRYGVPSEGVRRKVSSLAGPGAAAFLSEARFVILAHAAPEGEIGLDLVGAPFAPPATNRPAPLALSLPAGTEVAQVGECAALCIAPGRNEALRINGPHRVEPGDGTATLATRPREIFFHCSAAFARSRIWAEGAGPLWTGRRRFVCVARQDEAPGVASFLLRPQDAAPVGPVAPGQYVTVSLPDDPEGLARRRNYSVSARPDARHLRISVRRIGRGGLSDLLHDTLRPGGEALLGTPAGRFTLDSDPGRPVVLIGAGIGATPVLAMLEALAQEDVPRDIWFIHAARDSTHHLFREDVARITGRARQARIHLRNAYSRPREGDEDHHAGRLDAKVIAGWVPVTKADFYICGPAAFMDDLRRDLVSLGAAPERLHYEAFGTGQSAFPALEDATPRSVTFARSGRRETWTPAKGTLLDLALSEGIDAPFSCCMGDCQTCVQRLLGGSALYPEGFDPGLGPERVMLCQAIPAEDIEIDC